MWPEAINVNQQIVPLKLIESLRKDVVSSCQETTSITAFLYSNWGLGDGSAPVYTCK